MKTIKEAAVDYAEETKDTSNGMFYADCQDSFKSGVQFAQRWIPVEEELPETNEFCESKKCIVKNATYNCVDIARYYSNTNMWYFDSTDFIVTHWRPIDIT